MLCRHSFQNKSRKNTKINSKILFTYIFEKASLSFLSQIYSKSAKTIQRILVSELNSTPAITYLPKSLVLLLDAVYFDKKYSVLIGSDGNTGKPVYMKQISTETVADYYNAIIQLRRDGFVINGVVVDCKPGVAKMIDEMKITVQVCQFHFIKNMNKYIPSNVKLYPSIELRKIALDIPKSNLLKTKEMLAIWDIKNSDFLNEKTINPITKRKFFTHKKVRSARKSFGRHLKYLFVYLDYPDIPNTTNRQDGLISSIKFLLKPHRGLSLQNKINIIKRIITRKLAP